MRPQEYTADIAVGTSATKAITAVTLTIADTTATQVTRRILLIITTARAAITAVIIQGTLGMMVMADFTTVDSGVADSDMADLGMMATADTADISTQAVCYSEGQLRE